WIRHWILDPADHREYLDRLGADRVASLRAKADVAVHAAVAATTAPDLAAPANAWECAATFAARHLAARVDALGAHAVLAGAGVANLAAWLGVQTARARGSAVQLTAEIGLWGYEPMLGDPFVLNHGNFPTATMLGDAAMVLGGLVGGAGTVTIGCLGGAQVDRAGNINSTLIPDGPFLVGSGGGNDVASVATENVVVATLTPQRTPERCGYVTSPGRAVRALVTDLGVLEKRDGALTLTAVPAGDEPVADRVARAVAACGWDLAVAETIDDLAAPTADEVAALRRWDPHGWFLRG
ncbi:MAG: CoA-transferase, partial [Acidimicrobiia bacterium]